MTKSDAHIDNAVNHEGRPTGSDFSTLAAFGLFILIGGASSIGVLLVFRELTPFWSAALRFTLAALIFWLMVIGRRIPLPRGRALLGAILFGILGVGGSFIFVYLGLTRTPAALHQTIIAIVPLLTLFFAAAHKLEKITWRGLSGGILALVGIAIAAGGHMVSGTDLSLPHVLACGLAAVCFAEASIVIKLFPHSHPYATNAIAMTIGAVMLAAASWLVGENWVLPATAITWLVLIYLAVTVALNFLL
ncbi:MAG: EamA family transporter, partial [Candidatus Promineifilaceae bacterium]|nr:EamA family transporter [Candidatus Promineifilaceae bacterium]